MKKIILFIIVIISGYSGVYAHDEPVKTSKEKKEKEDKRISILDKNILSYTVWKHKIFNNKPNSNLKRQFLTVLYDKKGNDSEMLVFQNTDTLNYRKVFEYDKDNNMIKMTQYNSNRALDKSIKYIYDSKGLAKEQINYLGNNKIESKFTYTIDNTNNIILFNKYKPLDSIEYQILYKYEGNVDNGKNVEIIKQLTDETVILRVENIYNNKNKRTQKRIINTNNELMYYFEYYYFEDIDKYSSIVKKSPENKILSKTIYTLNDMGFIKNVKVIDESENILSYSSYEYDIRNKAPK